MSIVFLPLMKNSVDKVTRLEQSVMLSNSLSDYGEQLQIRAMIELLIEKFVKDSEQVQRLKGMMNVGIISKMIWEDAQKDTLKDVAANMLRDGLSIGVIAQYTGLSSDDILELQKELEAE